MLERNPFFTGRESILADISTFFAHQPALPLALCGIGGIGKTQIALEYAYRHQEQYQTVIWLDASTHLVLSVEIGVFADQHLHLTDAERMNEPQLFAAVKDWLQRQDRWLLVLDHIEDLTLVQRIVPDQRKGIRHVLLTTRQQVSEAQAHVLTIPMMDTVEGALFFLRRSGQIPLDASPEELNQWIMLIQRDPPSSAPETEATRHAPTDLLSDQITSYEVVPLSQKQTLQHLSAKSLALLRLLSFSPTDFPEHLLLGASVLNKPLRSLTHLDLDQMLTELLGVSLMDWSEGILHVPPVVQEFVLESLTAKQRRSFARQVIRLINHIFPVVRFDTRAECERYLLLAQHCATLISKYQLTVKEGGLLLERLGNYCYRSANYALADLYLTQARDLYEHSLSEEVLERAQLLNTLGLLYNGRARYQEAELSHLHALELREHVLGPDDPITAQSLHNLALVYAELGKYQEAERIYRRVLTIESADDDADSADTLNNLGITCSEMGRYAEAEEFYQQALNRYEQERGPDHPDVAIPLDGLGALAEEQSDYTGAEMLYQRALTIREHALDPKHPDIAYSLNHLADIYESLGKYQQAEEFYQRAFTIIERVFESEHPDIALLLNNLAYLANTQRRYQEAEPLYQRALGIYERVLGTEHPHVASVIHNLGRLYHNIGDNGRAEAFLRRALELREHALGPDHPDVAQSLSALSDLLIDQHRDEEAEPLLHRAFPLYLLAYGPNHPDVVRAQEKYAALQERRQSHEA